MAKRSDFPFVRKLVLCIPPETGVTKEGVPHLRRLSRIVEEVAAIRNQCKTVLVIGGARSVGRHALRAQEALAAINGMHSPPTLAGLSDAALAAAGYTNIVTIVRELLSQAGMVMAEVIVDDRDLEGAMKSTLRDSLTQLTDRGVVPLVMSSAISSATTRAEVLSISIASLCDISAWVLVRENHEIYDRDPHMKGAVALTTYEVGNFIRTLEMMEDIRLAKTKEIKLVVTLGAEEHEHLRRLIRGDEIGTLFVSLQSNASE